MRRRSILAVVAAIAAALVLAPAQPLARTRLGTSAEFVSYFPLRVGNLWVYERASVAGREAWRAAVTDRITAPNGRTYFTLAGYFGPGRHVRATLRNSVLEFNPDGASDNLWYLLGAPVGTAWVFTLEPLPTLGPAADCISGSRAILASRSEAVKVPAGEFRDVVRVEYRSPCLDAGLVSEWFAPGVGLVRRVEDSFAGPVVSELVRAEVGDVMMPSLPYTSALSLDRPLYVNNLQPPLGPDSIAAVRGVYLLRNRTRIPVELVFGGCKSVSVEVFNEVGEVALSARGDDGGCCECRSIQNFTLVDDTLALPFAFRLVTAEGRPLPDGRYTVRATLDVLEPRVKPSAAATIDVKSVC